MKKVFKIKLDIADITPFIQKANKITNNITLYQGQTVVNARSVLGIYALDLSHPVKLVIDGVGDEDTEKLAYTLFPKWIVND